MVLPSFLVKRLVGVQARPKKHAPHAVSVHCLCHRLQLACVQAANSMTGIKYVYTMLTTLWKYFHCSPKRADSLKEIQHVLNLPEMKVIKPSDTRWLTHVQCVRAVKASYIVNLDSSYQNFHAHEALGLYMDLSKFTPMQPFRLHFTISGQAQQKSSKKQPHLSMISSLVDRSQHTG